jgi:hypothetical protein
MPCMIRNVHLAPMAGVLRAALLMPCFRRRKLSSYIRAFSLTTRSTSDAQIKGGHLTSVVATRATEHKKGLLSVRARKTEPRKISPSRGQQAGLN